MDFGSLGERGGVGLYGTSTSTALGLFGSNLLAQASASIRRMMFPDGEEHWGGVLGLLRSVVHRGGGLVPYRIVQYGT